ncbi:MAG: hypothetical protein VB140_02725 [Burkholderia sp.]|nr:MAG: hypothetical protein E5299_00226 [Burkholderia gladioli]
MSYTITTVGKPFELQRVCLMLNFPRSKIYAGHARMLSNVTPLTLV